MGYEINFNRYFWESRPRLPLDEIEADFQQVGREIAAMLQKWPNRALKRRYLQLFAYTLAQKQTINCAINSAS